jgi:hypothetical protein
MSSYEVYDTPNQSADNPDFYLDVLGWSLTEEELDSKYNVIKVDSIDATIKRALLHTECSKMGERVDLGYEYVQLLQCPDDNILILREEKRN